MISIITILFEISFICLICILKKSLWEKIISRQYSRIVSFLTCDLRSAADDAEKLEGQRQEPGRQRQDRGHVASLQEPHGRQAGRQERAQRRHGPKANCTKRSFKTDQISVLTGAGKEPVSEAVRRAGGGARHHQAVLPRRRQRPQEEFPREERRTAVAALRPLPVHADHRRPHQNLRPDPNQRR